jgi:hypothetical protein
MVGAFSIPLSEQSRPNPRIDIVASVTVRSNTKPREISEIITHLAFYAVWANAMSAVAVVKVFAARNIGTDQLPAVSVAPLPINRRGAARNVRPGTVRFDHSGVVQYTTEVCSVSCGCGRTLHRGTAAL